MSASASNSTRLIRYVASDSFDQHVEPSAGTIARLDSIFWTTDYIQPKRRKRRYIERLQRKLGR